MVYNIHMNLEFPLEKKFPLGSGFGPRGALAGGRIKAHNHKGQDIAAPTGTKVKSVADGVVVRSTPTNQSGGYGNFIVIKHKDFYSAYGHLSKREVNKGDTVKKGQLIGLVGSTGQSTGPHLHFEIRKTEDGSQVDPKPYLTGSEINSVILDKTTDNDKPIDNTDDDKTTDDSKVSKISSNEKPEEPEEPEDYGLMGKFLNMVGIKENHDKIVKLTEDINVRFRPITDLNYELGDNKSILAKTNSMGKIYSPYDGIVVKNYSQDCSGYLLIQHEINGDTYYSQFCNIDKVLVSKNQLVSTGQVIGQSLKDESIVYTLLNTKFFRVNPKPFFKGFKSLKNNQSTRYSNSDSKSTKFSKQSKNNVTKSERPSSNKTYDDSILLRLALSPLDFVSKQVRNSAKAVKDEFKNTGKKVFDFKREKTDDDEKLNESIQRIKKLL